MLYYPILYYTTLYYTILHHTILHYTSESRPPIRLLLLDADGRDAREPEASQDKKNSLRASSGAWGGLEPQNHDGLISYGLRLRALGV